VSGPTQAVEAHYGAGDNLVEHLAGVDDYAMAVAAFDHAAL
jgi:hypothetical protein